VESLALGMVIFTGNKCVSDNILKNKYEARRFLKKHNVLQIIHVIYTASNVLEVVSGIG